MLGSLCRCPLSLCLTWRQKVGEVENANFKILSLFSPGPTQTHRFFRTSHFCYLASARWLCLPSPRFSFSVLFSKTALYRCRSIPRVGLLGGPAAPGGGAVPVRAPELHDVRFRRRGRRGAARPRTAPDRRGHRGHHEEPPQDVRRNFRRDVERLCFVKRSVVSL